MTRGNRIVSLFALLGLLTAGLGEVAQSQDPAVDRRSCTISGDVRLSDVLMKGLPDEVVTDSSGKYKAKVPYGWTGVVTPVKIGYRFEGPARQYPPVLKDYTGQDYRPIMLTFTISGNVGVSGVTMQGLPGNPVTDANGSYQARVDYGWSGIVTPAKRGHVFEPLSRRYTRVARDQEEEDYKAGLVTFTISGSTGLRDVALKGLPGNPATDMDGRYSVSVAYGWSGTVTPNKPGYVFEPVSRTYEKTIENLPQQNYMPKALTITISGSVGVPGAVMTGLPGGVVTDSQGRYRASVQYGWSGRIMPRKPGFKFDPDERSYPRVQQDLENEDYIPREVTLTISGSTGVPGVLMQGLPGNPVSDPQGNYRAQVEYGWSGVVAPQKAGHAFTPPVREYAAVTAGQNDENYAAEPQMVTISDMIMFDHEPIQDVTIKADPGDYTDTTDARGRYTIKVPYGWSGRLSMAKPGFEFDTSGVQYTNVTGDIIDGKRISEAGEWPPVPSQTQSAFPPAGVATSMGDVLVIPVADVVPEEIGETTEDLRVMLHILREKLSEPRMILGVLRDYGSFFGEDRKAEAFYLQGTAAVFVMHADFPRSLPTEQSDEGEAQQQAIDPVWQRARQKLHAPAGSSYGARAQSGQAQEMTFEQFRDELLRSLRHAANLRHVEPNELIILTVVARDEDAGWTGGAVSGGAYPGGRGAGGVAGGSFGYGRGGSRTFSGGFGYGGFRAPAVDGRGAPRPDAPDKPVTEASAPAATVLTMQAKKADIDAFARGDLDFEQFRQKARSFTY